MGGSGRSSTRTELSWVDVELRKEFGAAGRLRAEAAGRRWDRSACFPFLGLEGLLHHDLDASDDAGHGTADLFARRRADFTGPLDGATGRRRSCFLCPESQLLSPRDRAFHSAPRGGPEIA